MSAAGNEGNSLSNTVIHLYELDFVRPRVAAAFLRKSNCVDGTARPR